ncbi:MAG TPA: MinD/ParA family protein [Sedimentisphaerales bacterium]|nr:MinD/ParA family protein [Sedimentisphaerales bacterium]HRS09674.1 MinD/ParA family protein [Sedimentisphaerales bacterium]HRV46355.1 MinD/ParA family protein [Sedimentisphaerales bacterium]
MANQAVNLQQTPVSDRPVARVLAVTSGKGGVGKTNIATNLALCMAASEKRVLLLDADISLGNLDLLLNIRSKYNISHVINGSKRVEDIIQAGPQGLQIICGASGLDQLADISESEQRRLLQHLSGLQHTSDTIVIDTAAGISNSVVSFCLAADHVLVVTTPEVTAMTDAYGMIKVLVRKHFDGPISVVVNMAQSIAEGRQIYQRLADVAARFLKADLYYAGVLLKDERLCAAVRSRQPVVLAYPKSQIACSFNMLAARLGGIDCRRADGGTFFRRVFQWLT